MLGVKGRRFGGIGLKDMTEEEQQLLKHLRFSSGYHATRPCFTFGKLAKELLRGGSECDDMVRDYDIKASFPRALSHRHPWALWVRRWVGGQFLEHCPGLGRDAAKSFVNSCIGIGKEGIQRWCREHNFTTLPQALAESLADIRKLPKRMCWTIQRLCKSCVILAKRGGT